MHVFKLHTLCQYYDLGTPQSQLLDIAGGYQHEIAKLTTDKGSFAIKCLSKTLVKQYGVAHFIENEAYAAALAKMHIPACTALRQDAPILTLADQHYLAYPWQAGEHIVKTALQPKQAQIIGKILAEVHHYTFKPATVIWPKAINLPDAHTWQQYSEWLKASTLQSQLISALPIINDLLAAQRMMQPILANQAWAYSHTDLTPNNVIWQNDQPCIIDWELAGPIMPGQDVLATALNWSLDNDGQIRWPLFTALIESYAQHQTLPTITNISIIGTLIDWLAWVAFNLERVFDINQAESIRKLSAAQAEYSLLALQKTYAVRHELLHC